MNITDFSMEPMEVDSDSDSDCVNEAQPIFTTRQDQAGPSGISVSVASESATIVGSGEEPGQTAATRADSRMSRSSALSDKDALKEIFTCPICYDFIYLEFRQCPNSHAVCSRCLEQCPRCPMCRGEPPTWRNLLLESIGSRMQFPCRHEDRGCPEVPAANDWHQHSDNCNFRP